MPPTGASDPNAVSSKAMQWVKNRNNVVDMYLRREITKYEREKDINISYIDQDRLDIHDFMKQLKKCDSDSLPESKHWLGERTSSGRRLSPPPRRKIQTAPAAPQKTEEVERDVKTAPAQRHPQDDIDFINFQFRSRPKPELVQRQQTLHSIFSRRNELAAEFHQGWNDEEEGENDDGNQSEHRASSVTFQEGRSPTKHSAYSRFDSTMDTLDEGATGTDKRADIYRIGPPKSTGNVGGRGHGQDFMKELLVRKCRKGKKKKRLPLEDRIQDFYGKIDDLRQEEMAISSQPTDEETRRKWTLLTKGVKAALDQESDEEDHNPLHTL